MALAGNASKMPKLGKLLGNNILGQQSFDQGKTKLVILFSSLLSNSSKSISFHPFSSALCQIEPTN